MLAYFFSQDLYLQHVGIFFTYISSRSVMSFITSFIVGIFITPYLIRVINNYAIRQVVRSDGPSSHLKKNGTPTMGGLIIIISSVISSLIWSKFLDEYVILVLLCLLSYALIGFIDDYQKISLKSSKGLSARGKIILQFLIALCIAVYLYFNASNLDLEFPVFKDWALNLGIFFIPFAILVVIGSSNAVNLTDGLDGLVSVPIMFTLLAFAIIAYLTSNVEYSSYLHLTYNSKVSELVVIIAAIIGALFSFLWFNCHPAQIFMGDVGSLSLGACSGLLALLLKSEILLCILGGIFVVEALSVILQVYSFKKRGKRIFKMAPIHHHFELSGLSETKVVVRFWIVSVLLFLLAMLLVKIK